MSYEVLARTLRTYGFQFNASSLKSAFDEGPAASEWVQHHLTPDTFLSQDELESYTALEKSGRAEKLAASTDMSTVPPLSDQELRDAIEELDRSTAAISRQTETLRQQQDALARLVRHGAEAADARARMEAAASRRLEGERARLASEVEALSQGLGLAVADLERQVGGGGAGGAGTVRLRQSVDGLLRSDDRLLSSLQKLGRELEAEDPEEQEGVVKLREVCARLIKYTVETLRTKLDRVYLEALESSRRETGQQHQQQQSVAVGEVKAVQAELEELYTEILSVAQMSVEQQFLGPSMQSLTGRSALNLARSVKALNYIDACLNYLLSNITTLASRIRDYKAHESAAETLLGTAKAELAAQVDTTSSASSKRRKRAATIGASPVRRRRKSAGGARGAISPVRSRTNTFSGSGGVGVGGPRRRSSGAHEEPPLDAILRGLGLSLPGHDDMDDDDDENKDAAAAVAALEAALADRTAKSLGVARNLQASFEAAAAHHLADAEGALAAVRESALAETPLGAGQVALVDPGIDGMIGVLEREVGRVGSRLGEARGELKAWGEARGGRGRSVKREEIVKRWGDRLGFP